MHLVALALQSHASPDGIIPRSQYSYKIPQLCRVRHLRHPSIDQARCCCWYAGGGLGGAGERAIDSEVRWTQQCQITWMVLCRMLQFVSNTMRRVHSLRRSWAVLRIRSS